MGFASLAVLLWLAAAEPATLVLRHGRIVTVEPAQPEAQALAARGSRIVAVGTDEAMAQYVGPATEVIDLKGALAIPGFIEAHGHFTGIGRLHTELNLMGVRNWDEVVAKVREAASRARPGEWILGRGWHQEKWDRAPEPSVEGFPTHASLSAASPRNPVFLTHASGHASCANAKAMELAGVTAATPDPPGGQILRDARGQPMGVFREEASDLIGRALAASRSRRTAAEVEAESRNEIRLADEEVLSKGITTFEDAGSPLALVDVFKKMAAEGALRVRLWVMLRDDNASLAPSLDRYWTIGAGDDHLTIRAIKKQIDGALGSRGAWLLAPYSDLPTSAGLNTTSLDEMREAARLAIAHGYQLCVHAIGDRANRETLDLYERTFRENPGKTGLRWRIEHAQHLSAADIPRFGRLGVIAAMQGIHCTSDAPFVVARLGAARAEEGAYVWRKLLATGAVIANGTDAPVEDVSPVASFYSSVSRRLKDGTLFYPDQRMTREEALRSYTRDAAYAAFEEDLKGSLAPGKLADVTVLSKDILKVPEDEIPSAQVLYTIVGGRIAYRR